MDAMFSTGCDVHVPTADGHFVSEKQQRIAEIIKDYEPTLELVWIPPANREPGDKPFAVVHHPVGLPSYFVFFADECDERILERLWSVDNKVGNVLSNLEVKEAARKALQLKKEEDEALERQDIMAAAVATPLNTWSYKKPNGDKLVIKN